MDKRLLFIYIVITTLCTTSIVAQTVENEDFYSNEKDFYKAWWHNPAMRFLYPIEHHTEVSFNGEWENNEASLVQKGNSLKRFRFIANSFFKDTKKLFYGKAKYENGFRDGIKWNTLTDIEHLSPYILADTVEGKMNKESYFFAGGYATKLGKLGIGAFVSYNAATAFKEIDPRPLNTVSDLYMTIGTNYPFLRKHLLGAAISYEKYRQEQHLKIFKEVGSTKIFYLRGLGISEFNFTTSIDPSKSLLNKYKKYSVEGNFTLLPTTEKGSFASLSFKVGELELLSENYKEVSALGEEKANIQLGYKFLQNSIPFAVKFSGSYKIAKGNEYNYLGDSSPPVVAPKFRKKNYELGFAVTVKPKWGKSTYSCYQLFSNYISDEERYRVQNKGVNKQQYANINVGVKTATLIFFSKNSLLLNVSLAYKKNIDKKLNAGYLSAPTAKETLLLPDYKYLTSDAFVSIMSLRYDYKLNKKYVLYGRAAFHYSKYINVGFNRYAEIGIGLAF